jgi:hypothetical protein
MHKLSAFALAVLLGKGALAQVASADTAAYQQAVQAAVASYHQTINHQAELYNGIEHVRYLPTIEGIPYYLADEWKPGTIEYNGVVYRDVPMKYDMVKDQVIVKHPNGYSAFSLFSPRVAYFVVGGDRFVYIPEGSDKTLPPPGFYQELRTGALSVLAKRSKWIDEQVLSGKLEQKFLPRNKYYVLKDGKYTSPRNEADLLALLGERKKDAKQALQRAGIKFRKAPELAILTVADYYNK